MGTRNGAASAAPVRGRIDEWAAIAGELSADLDDVAALLRAAEAGELPPGQDAAEVVVRLAWWAAGLLDLAEPLATGWRKVYVRRLRPSERPAAARSNGAVVD